MKRKDLQELARLRLKEAKQLLGAGHPDGAHYLAGYCVECALKSCIARKTERFEFPDKARILGSYTHDLSQLLKTAGLDEAVRKEMSAKLAANWRVVRRWDERSRYERRSASEAEALINAIEDRRDGVLRWLKHRW